MALEASEIAVRVRLLGGSAYEKESQAIAKSTEAIGAAGKKADAELGATGLFSGAYGRKLDSIGSKMMSFGRTLTTMGVPIAALGYYAVKASSQFQASMMLLVTQANMPIKNLKALTKEVLNLSSAVNQTPNSLAQGLYPIVSTLASGKIKGNPIDLLRAASMGAGVGHDTVNATAEALTSAMAAGFGGSPQRIMGLLDAAVGQGKMHMADITEAMNTGILPLAQLMHISLPQMLASTAALTKQGINPSTVLSRMRLTLTSLASPTAAGIKAMGALGFKDPLQLGNDLRHGGIINMLNDLRMHTALFGGPNSPEALDLIARIFGKSRGIASIGSLLQAFPDLQSVYQNVLAYGNPQYLQTHFKQYQSTAAAKLQQARANVEKGMIALGDSLNKYVVPILGKLATVAAKLLSGFGQLPAPLREFLLGLMAFVVVGGPFFLFTGALVKGVGMVMNAIGLVTGSEGFGALRASTMVLAGESSGFLSLLGPIGMAAAALMVLGNGNPAKGGAKVVNTAADFLFGKGWSSANQIGSDPSGKNFVNWMRHYGGVNWAHLGNGRYDQLVTRYDATHPNDKQILSSTLKFPTSEQLKQAVKEGIQEANVNVYLDPKATTQAINTQNRRNQNRR